VTRRALPLLAAAAGSVAISAWGATTTRTVANSESVGMIGVFGPQPATVFYCMDMRDPTLREPRFARLRTEDIAIARRSGVGHPDCKLVLSQISPGMEVKIRFKSLVSSAGSPSRYGGRPTSG
jgi:hypothetical protein